MSAQEAQHEVGRRGGTRWRRALTTAAVAAAAAGLVLSTAPQSAAATPYRNWNQAPSNAAGVKFTPCGDVWELWDNVNDNQYARARFHYKGVDDTWKYPIAVADGYTRTQRNVYEKYHIYFQVYGSTGWSSSVEYHTNGGC
ncbi:hypothetical protein LHJ74_09450 [Streptomyces sp. N2-109]|uniref:Secreted protein n=1 Tax=Streptomyces gossypii TaxID=2883101 RepID=A0ABT2JRL3_9ACTN|nr:hypothetical protein [Streptomyces gossypii]MCT2590134.1 hypothetical protein [Streptomyces gossypii]